ncbi:unnamed protein product [Effrenium voratum]|uniref:Pentatricopeptide repeat-containing protein, chloroplastic n=1 Tax=Effrenium voratum TaxID=2562239 RepID=A0AA36IT16_9DINO|nr:unnamed protein product [Effrenium voratum]
MAARTARAARQESWQSQLQQLAGDVRSHQAAVGAFGKASKWQQALEVLWALPAASLEPNVIIYSMAISACEKGGSWQSALLLLEGINENTVEFDVICFNSAISACAKAAAWTQAVDLFRHLQSSLQPDVISYNAVISACERSEQWELALQVLQDIGRRQIEASIISFNTAASACGRAEQWQQSLRLFTEAQDRKLQSSMVSITAAIDACGAGGCWQGALELVLLSAFSLAACNAAISACGDNGRWRHALDIFSQLRSLQPDIITCSAMISAYEKGCEWQRACGALEDLRSRGLRPNIISFGSLISACEKGGEWQRALGLLEELRAVRLEPNDVVCNSAISACANRARWQLALLLLEELLVKDAADVISFSAAISACEEEGKWRHALQLLEELSLRVRANVVAFSAACSACAKGYRWQASLALFSQLQVAQLQPTVASYDACLLALDRGSQASAGLGLFGRLRRDGLEADSFLYRCMLSLCERAGEGAAALDFLGDLETMALAAWEGEKDVLYMMAVLGMDAALVIGALCHGVDVLLLLDKDVQKRTVELGAVSSLLTVCYDAVLASAVALNADMLDADFNRVKVELICVQFDNLTNDRNFLVGVREMQDLERGPLTAPLHPATFEQGEDLERGPVTAQSHPVIFRGDEDLFVVFDVYSFQVHIMSDGVQRLCQQLLPVGENMPEQILDIASPDTRMSLGGQLQLVGNGFAKRAQPQKERDQEVVTFNLLGLCERTATVTIEHDQVLKCWVACMVLLKGFTEAVLLPGILALELGLLFKLIQLVDVLYMMAVLGMDAAVLMSGLSHSIDVMFMITFSFPGRFMYAVLAKRSDVTIPDLLAVFLAMFWGILAVRRLLMENVLLRVDVQKRTVELGASAVALNADMLDADFNRVKVELICVQFDNLTNDRSFLVGVREMQDLERGPLTAPLHPATFEGGEDLERGPVTAQSHPATFGGDEDLFVVFDVYSLEVHIMSDGMQRLCQQLLPVGGNMLAAGTEYESEHILDIASPDTRVTMTKQLQLMANQFAEREQQQKEADQEVATVTFNLLGLGERTATATIERL